VKEERGPKVKVMEFGMRSCCEEGRNQFLGQPQEENWASLSEIRSKISLFRPSLSWIWKIGLLFGSMNYRHHRSEQ